MVEWGPGAGCSDCTDSSDAEVEWGGEVGVMGWDGPGGRYTSLWPPHLFYPWLPDGTDDRENGTGKVSALSMHSHILHTAGLPVLAVLQVHRTLSEDRLPAEQTRLKGGLLYCSVSSVLVREEVTTATTAAFLALARRCVVAIQPSTLPPWERWPTGIVQGEKRGAYVESGGREKRWPLWRVQG